MKIKTKHGQARIEVTALYSEIKEKQQAGHSLSSIHRELFDQGKVTVNRQAFSNQLNKLDKANQGKPQRPIAASRAFAPSSARASNSSSPQQSASLSSTGNDVDAFGIKQFDPELTKATNGSCSDRW